MKQKHVTRDQLIGVRMTVTERRRATRLVEALGLSSHGELLRRLIIAEEVRLHLPPLVVGREERPQKQAA